MNAPIAVVTGAGSGIGAGAARALHAQGHRIALVGRRRSALEEVARDFADPIIIAADLTDQETVERSFADFTTAHGAPTCVVHAAGATVVGAAHALEPVDWDRQFDINVRSIYLLNRVLWPQLEQAGGGSVVLVASTASHAAFPQDAAYCATKGAVLLMTKAMALDGAAVGIRVNAVSPGFIDTPNLRGYFDAQDDPAGAEASAARAAPLGRLGTPDEVGEVIAFLAGPSAAFITGTTIVVDGGLLAKVPT